VSKRLCCSISKLCFLFQILFSGTSNKVDGIAWIVYNILFLFFYGNTFLTAAIQTTEILSKEDLKLNKMVIRNPWKFYSSETGMAYVNSRQARTLLLQSTRWVRLMLALPIDVILLSRSQSMVTFVSKLITETVASSKHKIYVWRLRNNSCKTL
jgi:hypothetical protein